MDRITAYPHAFLQHPAKLHATSRTRPCPRSRRSPCITARNPRRTLTARSARCGDMRPEIKTVTTIHRRRRMHKGCGRGIRSGNYCPMTSTSTGIRRLHRAICSYTYAFIHPHRKEEQEHRTAGAHEPVRLITPPPTNTRFIVCTTRLRLLL